MQKKIKRGGGVHDARRFVVHGKSLLNHKARTHGFDIKTPTMHRHKMKDTIPPHPNTHQLSPTQQHSLVGGFFAPGVVTLSFQRGFMRSFGVTQPICGEPVHNMASCVCVRAASPPELDAAAAAAASDATSSSHRASHLDSHISLE